MSIDARTQERLTLTYPRRKLAAAAGLAYGIEWTDTLAAGEGAWSGLGVDEIVVASTSTTETVVASVPAGPAARFLRLRVTAP